MHKILVFLTHRAEKGQFDATLKLWPSQIKKLRREKFRVEILEPTECVHKYLCIILWIPPFGPDECMAASTYEIAHNKRLLDRLAEEQFED